MKIYLFFALVFLILSSTAFAADDGYYFDNQCFRTFRNAQDAFYTSSRVVGYWGLDSTHFMKHRFQYGRSADTYTEYFSYCSVDPVTSNTACNSTSSVVDLNSSGVNFPKCNYSDEDWSITSNSAVTFYVALMVCFLIGIRMGFLV